MVSTQSDGVGNLVDALCGRLPASVPVQLPGARPQRRPGILTEIEIGRDSGDFGEDTRETARLTEALMNLLPSEGTGVSSSRRDTPASAHFKDSMALVAPLILEYDDVTARQYERIVEQDAELDAMRSALESARGEMDAALEAERTRDAEIAWVTERRARTLQASSCARPRPPPRMPTIRRNTPRACTRERPSCTVRVRPTGRTRPGTMPRAQSPMCAR